jgi:hypothetical protein
MKPDGAEPEQVTNDEWNNWFRTLARRPWIAFISSEGGRLTDHPYYKRVYLRLMRRRRRPGDRPSWRRGTIRPLVPDGFGCWPQRTATWVIVIGQGGGRPGEDLVGTP